MNKDHITGRRHDSPKRGKLLPLALMITFGLLSLHGCGDNVGGEASLLRQDVGGEASLLRQNVGGKASSFAKTGQSSTAQMVADSTCQSNAMASTIRAAELRRPDMRVRVRRGDQLVLRTEGLTLTAEDSAVARWGQYSVTALHAEELPPMPEGMVNVTLVGNGLQRSEELATAMQHSEAGGFRLLPSGRNFSPYAELRVAYDETLLPFGYTPDDIYTSYYDEATRQWVRLQRVAVDTASHEIVSLTDHFTDFVNEVLKAPEMPETQAFVPTMMSELKAADPSEGITRIQPPTANNDGTATLSYPLEIPAGRRGMQPSLSLTYSSAGGPGWLGVGWDIPIPAISVDTRWGVPRYDSQKESETYLYRGEQLVAVGQGGDFMPLPHRTNQWTDRLPDGTRFFPRVDEAADSIVRHGTGPCDYWWEVWDRSGTVHRFGHYETLPDAANPSTLADDRGDRARWCLTESEDAWGNLVRYTYDTVRAAGVAGSTFPGVAIYLCGVEYTAHRGGQETEPGLYTVEFHRAPTFRTDAVVSCMNGFKEVDAALLEAVTVKAGGTPVRLYVLEAAEPCEASLFRTRLASVTRVDTVLAEHGMQWAWLRQRFPGGRAVTATDSNGARLRCGVPYAGVTTLFGYRNAPKASQLFGDAKHLTIPEDQQSHFEGNIFSQLFHNIIEQPTALGATSSTGWDIGGSMSVGVGTDVPFATMSIGGNYGHSRSTSRGLLTLIDLDGDGLSDKVYRRGHSVYWRRQTPHSVSDQAVSYGPEHELQGLEDFLLESGATDTWGGNISVGMGLSVSWPEGESFTTVYFSDVNGDGLPDLVRDGEVLFNSLEGGVPTFRTVQPVAEGDGQGGTVMVPRVTVSTSGACGGAIFDGEADPQIECATEYRDVSYHTEAGYRRCRDSMLAAAPGGVWERCDSAARPWRFSVATRECIPRASADPDLEAVQVWVAPRNGTVTVESEARLLPGGRGLRYADGVRCIVQHNSGPEAGQDGYTSAGTAAIKQDMSIQSASITMHTTNIAPFTVHAGDLVLFRLGSGVTHTGDSVEWRKSITYTSLSGSDSYGEAAGVFTPQTDFVVSGDGVFHAFADGQATISVGLSSADPVKLTVRKWTGGTPTAVLTAYSTPAAQTHCCQVSLAAHDSVTFDVEPADGQYVRWGRVVCRPCVVYTYTAMEAEGDAPGQPAVAMQPATVEVWPAPRMAIAVPAEYAVLEGAVPRALFGPLYRGWGQFAYLDDGAAILDVTALQLGMVRAHAATGTASDAEQDTSRLHSLAGDANEDMQPYEMDQLLAMSGAVDLAGDYSRWVPMLPDVRRQRHVGYGQTCSVTRSGASDAIDADAVQTGGAAPVCHDSAVPTATESGLPVRAIRKLTRSSSRSVALAPSLPVVTYGHSYSSGASVVETDCMDLNGDRYPDLVGPGGVQYSEPWGGIGSLMALPSWLSAASGSATGSEGRSFGGPVPVPERTASPSPRGSKFFTRGAGNLGRSWTNGEDSADETWADVNGDGLPDKVRRSSGSLLAALNLGYTFLPYEPWAAQGSLGGGASHSTAYDIGLPGSVNIAQASITGGLSMSRSRSGREVLLADVNGDGIPDLVRRGVPSATVCYGLPQGGLSASRTLTEAGPIGVSSTFNDAASAGLTTGVTIFGVAKVTAGLNGTPLSGGITRDSLQLADVNGDGLPDLVASDDEGSVTVRYNQAGGANLLTSVKHHDGGGFAIGYALPYACYGRPSRQWVMASLTETDLRTPVAHPSATTLFAYSAPRHDRAERTSYGFATVVTTWLDSNSAACRTLTEHYDTGGYARRGRRTSDTLRDGSGTLWTAHHYTAGVRDGAPQGDTACPTHAWVCYEATVTDLFEGQAAPQLTTMTEDIFDRHRNILRHRDRGDTLHAGDDLWVAMHYRASRGRNMVSLRDSVRVHPLDSTAQPLRRASFRFDSRGAMTEMALRISASATAATTYGHDTVYGNVTSVRTPPNNWGQNMTHTYVYDPVVHTYVDTVKDSYGRRSSAVYDLRFGVPVLTTDAAHNQVRYTYDYAGRLKTVKGPLSTGITLSHDYYPRGYIHNLGTKQDVPHWWRDFGMSMEYVADSCPRHCHAVTTHHSDDGASRLRTVTLADASRRLIQTKAESEVDSAHCLVVSGTVRYDRFGRELRRHDPDTEAVASGLLGRYRHMATPLRATASYDPLDRRTATATRHGSATLTDTYAYGIATVDGRRLAYTEATDAAGNVTTSFTDAFGRTVRTVDALGGVTTMVYDAMGQLLRSVDPEGFATLYTYDLMGRPASRLHPDAGLTTYSYDLAGNLIQVTNAAGETVSTVYHFLRPTGRHYSSLPQNNVTWAYDPAGRLLHVRDGSGTTSFAYDALGNVCRTYRIIALPDGDTVSYRFVSDFTHDSWGRMLSMVYPDGDTVRYGYDGGWNLSGVTSRKGSVKDTLVRSVLYDRFAHRTLMRYGNGTVTRYAYDDLQRLDSIESLARLPSSMPPMQRIGYSYDNVGNITLAQNHATQISATGFPSGIGGLYKYHYTYDALHRLTAASQTYGPDNALDMAYSPSGRLCSKRQTFTGMDQVFGYVDTDKPHAPRRIYDGEQRTLTDLMWDPMGNLAQASAVSGGYVKEARFLFWTEDSRLVGVVDDDFYSYYTYGHDGERALKLAGKNSQIDVNAVTYTCQALLDDATLYPSPYLVASRKGYTKHYYAGAERICARIGDGGLDRFGTFQCTDTALSNRARWLFKDCNSAMLSRQLQANDGPSVEAVCGKTPIELQEKVKDVPVHVDATVSVDLAFFRQTMKELAYPAQQYSEKSFYYHGDHLGSASWITDGSGIPVQHLQYLPFGEPYVSQHVAGGYEERFTFTGKERDEETGYGYFGTRYMDHELMTMWLSVDPMSDKYPSISPYAYCAWNPVKLVDPNGEEVYMLFYTKGNKKGDGMFKAAALTRKRDIENSSSFNKDKDIVVLCGVSDLSNIQGTVDQIREKYGEKYGKTKEFDLWSHGGLDGPTGSTMTSTNRLDDGSGKNQMSMDGWSSINFDWSENARASFYGCRTGVEDNGSSFAQRLSNCENFSGVLVSGMSDYGFPSYSSSSYQKHSDDYIISENNGKITYKPTYMVSTNAMKRRFSNNCNPPNRYKNGKKVN